MIGQNRQAALEQAKGDRDYADVNKLLVENTEPTRSIHGLTGRPRTPLPPRGQAAPARYLINRLGILPKH